MDDLVRERISTIPKVRRKSKPLPRFVPVIFGNGEDDDTPGLDACVNNEAVQLDDRIYEPGEDMLIQGKHLVITRSIDERGAGGRFVHIDRCRIEMRP